ncbi:MAG: tetratricopeptide repeat protein [Phycisphaerales bacterium]
MAEATVNNDVNGGASNGEVEGLDKAKAFFRRAEEVASTDNFDYAIDLFMEGLQRAPEAVEDGHKKLRYNSLVRQAKGGKKPSMMEKMKHSRGKTAIENMLNAEYLLAKDPENLLYAEQMLNAALSGQYKKTAMWIADTMFEACRAMDKPSISTLLLLKDAYSMMEQYQMAVNACGFAMKLKPDDGILMGEFKNLSARLTMQKGKYDQDFRDSIQDREEQEKLQAQQGLVKSVDVRQQAVDTARTAYEANKTIHTLFKLTDSLGDLQTDKADAEAIGMLERTYEQSRDFNYKKRSGEMKLRMLRRQIRQQKEKLLTAKAGDVTKESIDANIRELLSAELEHYRLCSENYPTDLRLKYEYGLRLMRNQKYDDAIPMFQAARKEPKYKIMAMNKIGLCFFVKGWFADAIDTLKEAMELYEIKDNDIAKDLRYNLARAYEQNGQTDDALELYRRIAQIDFSYKDVRARVNRLRKA